MITGTVIIGHVLVFPHACHSVKQCMDLCVHVLHANPHHRRSMLMLWKLCNTVSGILVSNVSQLQKMTVAAGVSVCGQMCCWRSKNMTAINLTCCNKRKTKTGQGTSKRQETSPVHNKQQLPRLL